VEIALCAPNSFQGMLAIIPPVAVTRREHSVAWWWNWNYQNCGY
jgi:hypothetical protein